MEYSFYDFLKLIGSLGLFLYGMKIMSEGLQKVAGDRLRSILTAMTTNRGNGGINRSVDHQPFIQSSSATTVMVVSFVNAGLLTLAESYQCHHGCQYRYDDHRTADCPGCIQDRTACGYLRCCTGQFLKGKKVNAFGEIFAGLGILFIGMDMMKDAMVPLQQSEAFIHAMTTISNPVLAILLGAGFTALIQSSSASVGILQHWLSAV